MPTVIKTNYTAGEQSPYMDGREDVNKYHNGASKMINATVLPHGGFVKRSGTEYIATALNKCNLLPFEFSVDDSLVLEFSNILLRFYKDGAAVFTPLATEDLTDFGAAGDSSLVAQYKMNANAATTAVINDNDSGTYDGVLYEGDDSTGNTSVATDTDGADGTNRSFDMSQLTSGSGMVEIADAAVFSFDDSSSEAMTLHIWVKPASITTEQDIMTKWTNSIREWRLYMNASGKVVFEVYDESANTQTTDNIYAGITTEDALAVDTWSFIVLTYAGTGGDSAASGMNLYVNRGLASSTSTNNASYVAMEDGASTVSIGGRNGHAQIQIDQDDGKATGNMTINGNLTAAFNGAFNSTGAACSAISGPGANGPAYIGKDWGVNNKKVVTGFKGWGSNNVGWNDATNPTITVTLQGSNDSTTGLDGTWADLGADSDTDDTTLLLTNMAIASTTAYRFHRLKITHNSGGDNQLLCAECEFYDTGGSSWTGKLDNAAVFNRILTAVEIRDLVTAGTTSPYSIVSPYTSAQAFQFHVTQSADVMYIAHEDVHPKKLSRLSDTSWTIKDVPFTGGPFLVENTDSTHLVGFARTGGTAMSEYYFPAGATGTLTATAHSPFNSDMVGALWAVNHTRPDNTTEVFAQDTNITPTLETFARGAIKTKGDYTCDINTFGATEGAQTAVLWRKEGEGTWQRYRTFKAATAFSATEDEDDVYYAMTRSVGTLKGAFTAKDQYNQGIVKITSFISSSVVSVEVVDPVLSDNSTDAAVTTSMWAEGAWSNYRGYPRTVTFFEDRLWWASSTNNPDTLWSSKSSLYEDMSYSVLGVDSDAITFPINDNEVSQIQWMQARQVMAVGAANKEYRFGASDITKPTTPSDRKATPQTSEGSHTIQPKILKDSIFFFQSLGKKLGKMKFDAISENFDVEDATMLAYRLFDSTPVDMVIQRVPDSIIWTVRTDGVVPTLTYEPKEDVLGWARQIFGNSADVETPTGTVESAAVIHGDDEDEVWLSILWDSLSARHIVKFKPRDFGSDIEDAFYVDSGYTYDGVAVDHISSGIDHLIGETVSIFADGEVFDDAVVNGNGYIDLKKATVTTKASVVQVGLPYTMKVRTMRYSLPQDDTTVQSKIKRIKSTTIRYIRSLLGTAGQEYAGVEYMQPISATYSTESQDTTPNNRLSQGGFSEDAYTTIISSDPVPFTALAAIIDVDIEK